MMYRHQNNTLATHPQPLVSPRVLAHRGTVRCECVTNLGKHMMEYLSEIISFLVGAVTGGFVVRLYVDKSTSNASQSGNKVGGDMAGRDIKKR